MKIDLPAGWTNLKLKEIGEIVGGGTPSTKNEEYFGGEIPWIRPSDLSNYHEKFIGNGDRNITKKGLDNSSAKLLPKGSLLFSSRAPIGYVAIAKNEVTTNQGFRSIIPSKKVYNQYLYYYLKASKEIVERMAGGTTFKEISGSKLGNLWVPLPPIKTQHRIVEKIEELFSDLDNGIQNLKKARQQLETYRQAVLKAAFEGRLTKQWREQQEDLPIPEELKEQIEEERKRYREQQLEEWRQEVKEWEEAGEPGKKPRKPMKGRTFDPLDEELEDLSKLPRQWDWIRISDTVSRVEYGTSQKSEDSGKVPVLRMGNMQDGKFVWDDLVYSNDPKEIDKYLLKPGDVLFNRTNSPELVGKTALYKGKRKAIFAGYLIRLNQIDTIIDARYLTYYLNSYEAQNYGNKVKTDGVNQSNINGTKLSGYPLPYTSLREQKKIADTIDSRLSIVEQTQKTIQHELQKAKALRQSILKRAFEGRLIEGH